MFKQPLIFALFLLCGCLTRVVYVEVETTSDEATTILDTEGGTTSDEATTILDTEGGTTCDEDITTGNFGCTETTGNTTTTTTTETTGGDTCETNTTGC